MTLYDTVLTNAHLATMQGDAPYGMIPNGAIAVKDGRIASVGPASAVPPNSGNCVVDLGGRWVTPGLIDCHTHIVYAGNRADLAVWDIGHPVELSYALGANPCSSVVRGGETILDQGVCNRH